MIEFDEEEKSESNNEEEKSEPKNLEDFCLMSARSVVAVIETPRVKAKYAFEAPKKREPKIVVEEDDKGDEGAFGFKYSPYVQIVMDAKASESNS